MTLGGRRFLLGCTVVAAGVCLALGVGLPFMRLTKFVFFGSGGHGHSLISAVNAMVRANQAFLGGVLLIFAVFLPLLKLLYLLLLAVLPASEVNRSAGQLRALEWLGRWSPHDILALLLTTALVASRETLAQRTATGAYFFAAAVILMLLAYAWLRSDASATRLRASATWAATASAARGPAFAVLLALAAGTLVLGVTLPAIRLGSAYAGTDVHSLASIVWALRAQGETLPWLVILTLAILLPGMRLLYLLTLVLSRALPHAMRAKAILAAEVVGRYAAADTMVLALMLFYLIASGDADALLQPGVYWFGSSALLTLLAYAWTNVRAPAAATQASSLTARLAGLASADTPGKS